MSSQTLLRVVYSTCEALSPGFVGSMLHKCLRIHLLKDGAVPVALPDVISLVHAWSGLVRLDKTTSATTCHCRLLQQTGGAAVVAQLHLQLHLLLLQQLTEWLRERLQLRRVMRGLVHGDLADPDKQNLQVCLTGSISLMHAVT